MTVRSAATDRLSPGVRSATKAIDEKRVYLAAAAVFVAAGGLTLHLNLSMAGGMAMPGNWTMSMMWMRMPGQTWLAAAVVFLIMWQAMMVAMMLPSSMPMLLLYRRAAAFRHEPGLGSRLWLVGTGYFAVWLAFGGAAYAVGLGIAEVAMRSETASRAVPLASALALVVAGAYQLTPWKSACLRHCRDPLEIVSRHLDRGAPGALRLGLEHGAFCAGCCWALMLIQLALGVMSLPAMVAVASVIAFEKLSRPGELVARLSALAAVAGGTGLAWVSLG